MLSLLHKRSLFLFCSSNYQQYHKIRDRLIKYPYTQSITAKVIDRIFVPDPNDFLQTNLIKDSVAFASLKQHKQESLKLYYQHLFESPITLPQQVSGANIFVEYHKQNRQQIKNAINFSENQEEVTYNLKKLMYIMIAGESRVFYEGIDLNNIKKRGKLCQKAFLVRICERQQTYLDFMENFVSEFQNSDAEAQLEAALVLISIDNFQNFVPKKLSEMAITRISQNLSQMNEIQILRIIQLIFQTNFPSTMRFADSAKDYILNQISTEEHPKIPLMMKIIKLRQKLRMNNSQFQNYIKDYPLRFKSIFQRRNVDKQAFLEIVAQKSTKRLLPQQVQFLFEKYVSDHFNEVFQTGECNSQEFIQTIKLILKFRFNISESKKFQICQSIEGKFLIAFAHQPQLQYWMILLAIIEGKNFLQTPQNLNITQSLLQKLSKGYQQEKNFNEKRNLLQKITELYYHIYRNNAKVSNLDSLWSFDWNLLKLLYPLVYSCFVINKIHASPQRKFAILKQLRPKIQLLFDENKVRSIKHLYVILGAIQSSKCQESRRDKFMSFLYKKIQKCFMFLLKNKTQPPTRSDLLFLKKVFDKNRKQESLQGSKKHEIFNFDFMTFINDTLNNPEGYQKHYDQYTKKQKAKRHQ